MGHSFTLGSRRCFSPVFLFLLETILMKNTSISSLLTHKWKNLPPTTHIYSLFSVFLNWSLQFKIKEFFLICIWFFGSFWTSLLLKPWRGLPRYLDSPVFWILCCMFRTWEEGNVYGLRASVAPSFVTFVSHHFPAASFNGWVVHPPCSASCARAAPSVGQETVRGLWPKWTVLQSVSICSVQVLRCVFVFRLI